MMPNDAPLADAESSISREPGVVDPRPETESGEQKAQSEPCGASWITMLGSHVCARTPHKRGAHECACGRYTLPAGVE